MSCYLLLIIYWRRLFACSLLTLLGLLAEDGMATEWLAIKKTDDSQLMVDKQSLIEEKPYTKAWIKVDYKTPQKNPESVDRLFNNAKALWYFDCDKRKAATIQVFQYEDQELVYSAGTTTKQADFIEPLPESEVEIAQQYVCKWQAKEKMRAEAALKRANAAVMPAVATGKEIVGSNNTPKTGNAPMDANPNPSSPTTDKSPSEPMDPSPAGSAMTGSSEAAKASKSDPMEKKQKPTPSLDKNKQDDKNSKADTQDNTWSYSGKNGQSQWGKLSDAYASCEHGSQQSPIDIENTIPAALKPIKRLQKFPLKSIARKDHGFIIDAGTGNMMVLDQKPYQLKYLSFHVPAEHQIKQKTYAAELHMVHEDKSGHHVIIAVMLEEGSANPVLDKILGSLPKENEASKSLAIRVTPAELMPAKPGYYRYSGSMTTPPCSEGVQWVIMKEPLKASKAQLNTLQQAMGEPNQRALQDNQGRMILE